MLLAKSHGTPPLKRFIRFSKGARGKGGANIQRILERVTWKNGQICLFSQRKFEMD